jgi:hypothetical protein
MRYKYTNGCNPDFIALCRQLDDFPDELAGGRENRAQYISPITNGTAFMM